MRYVVSGGEPISSPEGLRFKGRCYASPAPPNIQPDPAYRGDGYSYIYDVPGAIPVAALFGDVVRAGPREQLQLMAADRERIWERGRSLTPRRMS